MTRFDSYFRLTIVSHRLTLVGDCGAEAGGKAWVPMPLSNLPVFKQCCGTGPSRDQAPGECQPGLSIIRWSMANDSRLRDSAHDPERPSEVVAERGCAWTDSVHPENPRIEKLSHRYKKVVGLSRVQPDESFLQHNHLNRAGRGLGIG
jgi:hypothetical protein